MMKDLREVSTETFLANVKLRSSHTGLVSSKVLLSRSKARSCLMVKFLWTVGSMARGGGQPQSFWGLGQKMDPSIWSRCGLTRRMLWPLRENDCNRPPLMSIACMVMFISSAHIFNSTPSFVMLPSGSTGTSLRLSVTTGSAFRPSWWPWPSRPWPSCWAWPSWGLFPRKLRASSAKADSSAWGNCSRNKACSTQAWMSP
mmetsp:Transcript_49358/g.97638  ORF Transcript_49358/g.97638 Transcript_49358/m.97638 type:complete len:200 (+) Transcript_49358:676-1275(+)